MDYIKMASELVNSATSEKLAETDWMKNIEICELVARDQRCAMQAKDVIKAIKKRIGSKNTNTQLYAVLLLEMLMNNVGETIHKQVIDSGVLPSLVKIVKKKSNLPVRERIFLLLDATQTALGGASGKFPQYYQAYYDLVSAGVQFPQRPPATPSDNAALVAASSSLYLVLLSSTFDPGSSNELLIRRTSSLSDMTLGFSVGYFLSDLAMVLWYFPALGGLEYVLHHGLSLFSIIQSLLSGQGQVYILMVLFTECTTPFVNLRWYLDNAGQKNSNSYVINGIALFLGWLVARILLFIYFFGHMFKHFDQVKTVYPLGFYSLLTVPPMLAMMNVFWFWKIARGMIKTLRKARHNK